MGSDWLSYSVQTVLMGHVNGRATLEIFQGHLQAILKTTNLLFAQQPVG
jgi:hypothetical protein